jgi:4,5-dihydroxyphthalate decarboxylase
LTFAISEQPHTRAVRDGSIPIEGVDAEMLTIKPQIGAFRRMVRDLEFDVCELAPTTYIIARSYGIPIVALPIFIVRRFHHTGLLVRPEANIQHPKDLEGHKVGVRAYSVTTGAWTRGILIDEYGLDSSKVTWVVDDEEHVQQLELPENVVKVSEGDSLADMMARGELVAGFHKNAGIGRKGSPTGGWQEVEADYPDLFPNGQEVEFEYFRRTGIYPMHGTIVVKESVLKENPWVAKSIYDAFLKAKNDWLDEFDQAEPQTGSDRKYKRYQKVVGRDILPYGVEANRKSIEALALYAWKQGLTPRLMTVDELFVDPEQL